MKKQYWYCVVGSVDSSKIPDGADLPMRMGVREGMSRLPQIFQDGNADISSGWGITEEQWREIQKILYPSILR